MANNTDRIIELFNEAKAKAAGPARERFVNEACAGEVDLREQIVSLLSSEDQAGGFLRDSMFSPIVLTTEKPGDLIGRYKLLEKNRRRRLRSGLCR